MPQISLQKAISTAAGHPLRCMIEGGLRVHLLLVPGVSRDCETWKTRAVRAPVASKAQQDRQGCLCPLKEACSKAEHPGFQRRSNARSNTKVTNHNEHSRLAALCAAASMDGSYSFASEPRPVQAKFRPERYILHTFAFNYHIPKIYVHCRASNIHSDPRVARGSTYSSALITVRAAANMRVIR